MWTRIDDEQVYVCRCCKCESLMLLPKSLHDAARARAEKLSFFCPHGHAQVFTEGKSDVEKLREQLEAERRARQKAQQSVAMWQDEARREQRRAAAMKGVATRMKNRVKRGVCPCCNRTFSNLAAHMKSQHPEFDHIVKDAEEATGVET